MLGIGCFLGTMIWTIDNMDNMDNMEGKKNHMLFGKTGRFPPSQGLCFQGFNSNFEVQVAGLEVERILTRQPVASGHKKMVAEQQCFFWA